MCDACSARFRTRSNLMRHVRNLHRGILFTGTECSAKFRLPGQLEDHERTHEELEPPFHERPVTPSNIRVQLTAHPRESLTEDSEHEPKTLPQSDCLQQENGSVPTHLHHGGQSLIALTSFISSGYSRIRSLNDIISRVSRPRELENEHGGTPNTRSRPLG